MRKPKAVQVVSGLEIARVKVVHVLAGIEAAHGGPSYSVPRLNTAVREAGIDSVLLAGMAPGAIAPPLDGSVLTFPRAFSRVQTLRKLELCPGIARQLADKAEAIDVIHSHGLWRMPNIDAARAARRHRVPHVISPRGMLSRVALGFSRSSKGLFWHALQKSAVLEAACLHATSQAEHDELKSLGITRPIAVVPNGIDLPDDTRLSAPSRGAGQRTLLYLGRIHPKKGLDILIAAWARVAAQYPGWRLRMVGPAEPAHLRELHQLVATHQAPCISIEGPIYGDGKWRIYSEADLFVLPTYNENFGLTVAESFACRRPAIVSKGAPWGGVETNRCGWWVDATPDAFEGALRTGLSTPPEELDAMGARGACWVREAFAWEGIGRQMAAVYRWLTDKENKPDCVR